jgi:hypothetical protein
MVRLLYVVTLLSSVVAALVLAFGFPRRVQRAAGGRGGGAGSRPGRDPLRLHQVRPAVERLRRARDFEEKMVALTESGRLLRVILLSERFSACHD